MLINHQNNLLLVVLILSLFVSGCVNQIKQEQRESFPLPSKIVTEKPLVRERAATPTLRQPSIIPATPSEIATGIPPDTGWQNLRRGLERRVHWVDGVSDIGPEKIFLLRIDPDYFEFEVSYTPGEPKSLTDWMAESGAIIVVNGGYFTKSWKATGLVIIDGKPSGQSYQDFGGMVSVTADGIKINSLVEKPYTGDPSIISGLQSFPMLVKPGNRVGYTEKDENRARRTAIAQDHDGNILFILASSGTFTLHDLSKFLVDSDLALDIALNLDGGASTGLLLKEPADGIPPFTALPIVITVYPRTH